MHYSMTPFIQIDYMERAKRMVEIPKLEKQFEEQIHNDRLFHEQAEEEKVGREME